MEGQITIAEWAQWKEDMRLKLQETRSLGQQICNNFVYIGYNLKMAEQAEAYKMDGFDNIYDFAKAEYGLGRSDVTRYKQINDRYSIGGNSQEIKEDMREFGLSQLVAMLSLPDEDHGLITGDTTVREIRELTNFEKGKLPGMEEAMQEELEKPAPAADIQTQEVEKPEQAAAVEKQDIQPQNRFSTPMQKCIFDFFSNPGRKNLLNETVQRLTAHDFDWENEPELKQIADNINPSGMQTHSKGIVFLFLYEYDRGVAYKQLPAIQPVKLTWKDFLQEIQIIYNRYYLDAVTDGDIWGAAYGKITEEPEKIDVPGQMTIDQVEKAQNATSHTKTEQKKTEKQIIKPEPKPAPEPVEEKQTQTENVYVDAEYKEIATEKAMETPESAQKTKCQPDFEAEMAAVVEPEEIEDIWDEVKQEAGLLELFMQDWSETYPMDVPENKILAAHTNAINMAAALERLKIAMKES